MTLPNGQALEIRGAYDDADQLVPYFGITGLQDPSHIAVVANAIAKQVGHRLANVGVEQRTQTVYNLTFEAK